MMRLSVAICTYNRERYLPQVLDSLVKQSLERKLFEVLLINNNSPGNTKEISDEFQNSHLDIHYTYYLETNQGLSHARNRAIQEAKGEYITFIDDDAFIADDYLEVLMREFDNSKDLGALGGKILLHYESIVPKWENKYLNSLLGFYDKGNEEFFYSQNSGSDYPRGSNMAFRTTIFNEIGLFNVNLGRTGGNLMGGEEKDIFNRIYSAKKYTIKYVPSALVYHCVPFERTTQDFIRTQGIQTGKSERIRTKSFGNRVYFKRCMVELLKWGGTIVLALGYYLRCQGARATMLLKFRFWVSKGLMTT